ncbi:MAG: metal-sensing transcriptional repressor [Candidatus Izemoplasmatales bacterium]|nr:metal-sensing transcriptional repressor [bacterium]MDZ4196004.1 metal-sensing transcriptional repressor [Candidatus Izemoplasmatales bacterium]
MKANHQEVKKLLNTAKGQIEGISRMVDEDRYCIEVSTQVLAAQAVLKKVNQMILKAHLDSCVLSLLNEEGQQKMTEIFQLMDKIQS